MYTLAMCFYFILHVCVCVCVYVWWPPAWPSVSPGLYGNQPWRTRSLQPDSLEWSLTFRSALCLAQRHHGDLGCLTPANTSPHTRNTHTHTHTHNNPPSSYLTTPAHSIVSVPFFCISSFNALPIPLENPTILKKKPTLTPTAKKTEGKKNPQNKLWQAFPSWAPA